MSIHELIRYFSENVLVKCEEEEREDFVCMEGFFLFVCLLSCLYVTPFYTSSNVFEYSDESAMNVLDESPRLHDKGLIALSLFALHLMRSLM